MIIIGPIEPPPRECNCDYPSIRYRNGTGHDPSCPIHWHFLEDQRPGYHVAEAAAWEALKDAESDGNPSASPRNSPSHGLMQFIQPNWRSD